MADAKYSFQEKGRIYYPAWMSPDGMKFSISNKFIFLILRNILGIVEIINT